MEDRDFEMSREVTQEKPVLQEPPLQMDQDNGFCPREY